MNRTAGDHEHEDDGNQWLLVGWPWPRLLLLAVLVKPLEATEKRSVIAWSM
jgi:hypothetical protein